MVILMRRSKGLRRGTRKSLQSYKRLKITDIIREFNIGDKVAMVINPSYHKGMPFRRFHGKVGEVIGKRGNAYIVKFKDGNKEKIQIVMPAHLKKVA